MRVSRRQLVRAGIASILPIGPLSSRAALADDASANAQARWLAGLAALPGVAPSPEWVAYAKSEDVRWRVSEKRVAAMDRWAMREVLPLLPPDAAVFYPFAGPDALHALSLFGGVRSTHGARRIVLVGLEPVGALPDFASPAAGFFRRLDAALADVHRLTFFRTREMSADFRREGVVAALVATIARMGGTVSSVNTSSTRGHEAARVDWMGTSGEPRRLDYIQVDLANSGLHAASSFTTLLDNLAPYVTFVKAAMFLLHEPRFASLRQRILDDSSVVVQDDTGIPFRSFDERWATRLFGRYEPPGAPFESFVQPALAEAFKGRTKTALPFGIGYHVRPERSNLLIASKGRQ